MLCCCRSLKELQCFQMLKRDIISQFVGELRGRGEEAKREKGMNISPHPMQTVPLHHKGAGQQNWLLLRLVLSFKVEGGPGS